MMSRFGFELHPQDVRWAAAEGVSQDVIAAVLLLHERSVDEIAPQLSAAELEQTIVLVGRSPRLYARGTPEALENKRVAATFAGRNHPTQRCRARKGGVSQPRPSGAPRGVVHLRRRWQTLGA
jgi:hypothetical protein